MKNNNFEKFELDIKGRGKSREDKIACAEHAKTLLMKETQDADVIVIEPNEEWRNLAELLRGDVLINDDGKFGRNDQHKV